MARSDRRSAPLRARRGDRAPVPRLGRTVPARHVAFFRNLNLGRPRSPTRQQFEQAFLDAGASEATSFLTNGTLVFSCAGRANPQRLLAAARKRLAAACGLVEPAFVRTLEHIADLVVSDPFAQVDRNAVHECCVTFLHPAAAIPTAPVHSPRRDVEVLGFTQGEALSLSRKVGRSPGSPNALLEKLLGVPATTRNWNTLVRLVHKYR